MGAKTEEVIGIDSNILIYAHRERTAEHSKALAVLKSASADFRGWGLPLPGVAEFLSVTTHPKSIGRPSTAVEASEFLFQLEEQAGLQIWLPHEGFAARFSQMAIDLGISGIELFDLQMALVAFENGAGEFWTHDRDFVRIPGLKVLDPLSG